jgi:hypothetical protein
MPNQWRDISEAPKDGTLVLIAFTENGDDRIRLAAWEAHSDSSYPFVWKTPGGSILVREWKDDPEPTHFMFLPDPPTK